MATVMKSLKPPPFHPLWETVFQTIGTFVCLAWPVGTLIRAYIQQGVWPDDPWRYGLLGIGSLLFLICEYLKSIRACLQAPIDMVYMVLKDPDDDERQITLATFRHVRRRLGLPDSES